MLAGRYRIVGILGRGGMGIVYAADDLKLAGKLRAIKVIAPLPDGGGSYTSEARTMMKLKHPHLPIIVDYFPTEELDCEALVMDYIEGQTVAALFGARYAVLTFAQIVHIGLQLCSALIHLHGQTPPIIHRDLKPSNVMIDNKWHVTLIDFGISRLYKKGQQQDTAQLGTVGFAAPEQGGTGQSDERTDIYGLGALLYFMASGGTAYDCNDESRREKDPFTYLQSDIPSAFKVVLQRLMQLNPQYRYRSVIEVEAVLKQYAQAEIPNHSALTEPTYKDLPQSNRILICLLSLSPGAGATFLSHTLTALLGQQGVTVTAAEYGHLRPEWHAWLTDRNHKRTNKHEEWEAFDERYIHYKHENHTVNWFALHPGRWTESVSHEHKFEQMLHQAGGLINLIDLSSKWNERHALQLLKQARFVFVVGDPSVAKWQAGELRQLESLKRELQNSGGEIKWIANKDIRFRGRTEWLSLFPELPLAVVPRLPEDVMLTLQWEGRGAADDARLRKRLNHALQPVYSILYNDINTK